MADVFGRSIAELQAYANAYAQAYAVKKAAMTCKVADSLEHYNTLMEAIDGTNFMTQIIKQMPVDYHNAGLICYNTRVAFQDLIACKEALRSVEISLEHEMEEITPRG